MLIKQLYAQRKAHFLTIISMVLSILLIIIVETATNNIHRVLTQQIDRMGLNISFLNLYQKQENQLWLDRLKKDSEYFISFYSKPYDSLQMVGIDNDLNSLFIIDYQGRMINPIDYLCNDNVTVLGYNAQSYFDFPKIDEFIYINSIPFKVIGLLEKSEENIMIDLDNSIFVPKDYLDQYSESYYFINNQSIENYLSNPKDYLYLNQSGTEQSFHLILNLLSKLLSFLSGFSGFIAMIGLLNNALSNLKSRVKEIGLKRSLGARRNTIFLEVLFESFIITIISFVISLLLALLIIKMIDTSLIINFKRIISTCIWISGVSIVFGFISAIKASRITIIDSLKQ